MPYRAVMMTIRLSKDTDAPVLLDIWRRAVRATHHFLTAEDFVAIEAMVANDYLPITTFWIAAGADDRPVGFMGLSGAHIDSLFVDPDRHGAGIGRLLVGHAVQLAGPLTVDVNAQNPQAVGFYRHLGFGETGRSDCDNAGRPYPLLHLSMAR